MNLNKKNIFTLLISLIFMIFVFHNIDFQKLVSTFQLFDYKILLLIIPASLIAIGLRGIRWKFLLPDCAQYSSRELSGLYSTGSAINVYFPARAGDLFRAYFLGKKYDQCKLGIFGSIVLERIFDGLTVVFMLLTAIVMYYKKAWLIKLSFVAAAAFVGGFIVLFLLFKFNKTDDFCNFLMNQSSKLPEKYAKSIGFGVDKLNKWLNSFINGLESISKPKNALIISILSVIIWTIECAIIYSFVINFGFDVSFSISLFVISFIALATIIPSTSIYVGPYQYAFILALSIYHIDKSSALAIAFTQQTVSIIILSVISFVFFLKSNIKFNDIKQL